MHVSRDGLVWEEVTDERFHELMMDWDTDCHVNWSNEDYARYVRSGNAAKLAAAGLIHRLPIADYPRETSMNKLRGKKYLELLPDALLKLITNCGALKVSGLPADARIEFGEFDLRRNIFRFLVSSQEFSREEEAFGQHLLAVDLVVEDNGDAQELVKMIRELADKLGADTTITKWRGDAKGGGD